MSNNTPNTENKIPSQASSNEFGLPKMNFKPVKSKNNTPKIISILILLLISGGAIYWFFFYKTTPQNLDQYTYKENSTIFDDSDDLAEPSEEIQVDDDIKINDIIKEKQSINDPIPTNGSIVHISKKNNMYYVIANSFIDKDLAMDYAKKIIKQGVHAYIIEPVKGKLYFRVAIEQVKTYKLANQKATYLKNNFGHDLWILRY